MENSDRHRVLVAVSADRGGKRSRLVWVIVDRVESRQRRRVRSDDVHILAQVVHAAVDVAAHRVHALISVPELAAVHGVRASLRNRAARDVCYPAAAHIDIAAAGRDVRAAHRQKYLRNIDGSQAKGDQLIKHGPHLHGNDHKLEKTAQTDRQQAESIEPAKLLADSRENKILIDHRDLFRHSLI